MVSSVTEIDRLRDDWRSLLAIRESVTPFETLEWTRANLLSFPDQQTRILKFVLGNDVVAILPLVLRRRRKHLRRRNWLEFASLPYADYGACLITPGLEAQVADAFVSYLGGGWDGAFLDGLRKDDKFTHLLYKQASFRGIHLVLQPTHEIRRLDRTLSSEVSIQFKRSIEKERRKLSQIGPITFEVITDADRIQSQMNHYFEMHIERCAMKGTACPLASASQQGFFCNIVRNCAPAGHVWLSMLYSGQHRVASRFSLRYGNALHLYSTCFAPAFAKYSPSMLQLERLIEYAFANGIDVIDFGFGDSPQKEKSGAIADRQLVRLELYRSREAYLESKLYLAAQRKAAKPGAFRTSVRLARKLLPYQ